MDYFKMLEKELHAKKGKSGGWPADSGPLADLHKLGMIPDPQARPSWTSWPKVVTLTDGRTQYQATAKVLHGDAIQALAALSFEGYHVRLATYDKSIEIQITEQS